MMQKRYIGLFLLTAGLVMSATSVRAQAKASATVTLRVVAATGLTISQVSQLTTVSKGIVSASPAHRQGITFQSAGNVSVTLRSGNSGATTLIDFGKREAKTLTARELRGVSAVQVIYLGS